MDFKIEHPCFYLGKAHTNIKSIHILGSRPLFTVFLTIQSEQLINNLQLKPKFIHTFMNSIEDLLGTQKIMDDKKFPCHLIIIVWSTSVLITSSVDKMRVLLFRLICYQIYMVIEECFRFHYDFLRKDKKILPASISSIIIHLYSLQYY